MLKAIKIKGLTIIIIAALQCAGYMFPNNSYGQEAPEITEFRITNTYLTKDSIQINYNLNSNNDAGTNYWLVTTSLIEPTAASSWSGTKPNQITLGIRSGSIILYAWVKNSLGEISRPVSANTVMYPVPVQNTEEFKSNGTSYFRFNDKYGRVNFPIADLLIVAGGGGGGGGGSGKSETNSDGSNTCEEGSGGGGGGAGQVLNVPAYSLDPSMNYQIYIGDGGDYGRGGGKHYSGHSGDSGAPSYFLETATSSYVLYAHPGGGGERGRNKGGDDWGDGGSGYPGGSSNHGDGHGGNGGNNGSGYGRGGDGGEGSNCHSSGHKGDSGDSGYMSIKWKGILNK
ncbi:MAG: hypothetical protein JXB88_00510 [Spirochaetales bacterium]|nr:hypothetical protein [Spirochaetales bacterium]